MSTPQSSSSQEETQESKMPRRPSEIDAFVDRFLTTVCDTSRRYIVELLALPDENGTTHLERRSGDIARAIGLSAATTSEHLRHLSRVGLVTSRREGNIVYYKLRNHKLVQAFQDLLEALDNDYGESHIQSP